MPEANHEVEQATVSLLSAPLEHNGLRVVTLALIDNVHGRPDGTAKRAFHRHRDRLREGEDYFRVAADDHGTKFVQRSADGTARGFKGELVLFSESGYLLLVKSFHDDLAWDVQRRLVSAYFRSRPAPAATLVPLSVLEEREAVWGRRLDAVFALVRLERRSRTAQAAYTLRRHQLDKPTREGLEVAAGLGGTQGSLPFPPAPGRGRRPPLRFTAEQAQEILASWPTPPGLPRSVVELARHAPLYAVADRAGVFTGPTSIAARLGVALRELARTHAAVEGVFRQGRTLWRLIPPPESNSRPASAAVGRN